MWYWLRPPEATPFPPPPRLSESLTRDGAKIRAHIRLVLEVTPPPWMS